MHCYHWPDKSELPPGSWFGASASAGHISLYTVYDTAWMIQLPEFCLLLIWRGQFNSMRLCIFWLSMFIILSIHHIHVMNRHPAGPWYGKLDILWFMKRGVFIFCFYSWPPNLAVNAFKTDSALLDSWIKTMLPIMTTGWRLVATQESLYLPVFSSHVSVGRCIIARSYPPAKNFRDPYVCVTFHKLV